MQTTRPHTFVFVGVVITAANLAASAQFGGYSSSANWVRVLKQGETLLGKSKADTVAVLGTPQSVFGGKNGGFYRGYSLIYKYPLRAGRVDIMDLRENYAGVVFNDDETAALSVEAEWRGMVGPQAGNIWLAVDAISSRAPALWCKKGDIRDFWEDKHRLIPSREPFKFLLVGTTTRGNRLVLTCTMASPPLRAVERFNPDTNQTEVADLQPIPAYAWWQATTENATILREWKPPADYEQHPMTAHQVAASTGVLHSATTSPKIGANRPAKPAPSRTISESRLLAGKAVAAELLIAVEANNWSRAETYFDGTAAVRRRLVQECRQARQQLNGGNVSVWGLVQPTDPRLVLVQLINKGGGVALVTVNVERHKITSLVLEDRE